MLWENIMGCIKTGGQYLQPILPASYMVFLACTLSLHQYLLRYISSRLPLYLHLCSDKSHPLALEVGIFTDKGGDNIKGTVMKLLFIYMLMS